MTSEGPAPLRVLFDATAIPANLGGVGRYVQGLVPALARRSDLELTVVCSRRDAPWIARLAPEARVVALGRPAQGRAGRLLWEQVGLPALARRYRAEVLHSPHYTMPLLARLPVVVTMHDAMFFSLPAMYSSLKGRFFRSWIRISARLASRVVVPSDATRRELLRYAPGVSGRIDVSPHGLDPRRFHEPDPQERLDAEEAFGPGPWIAFLGTIEPRKNVPELVRAFAAVLADEGIARDHPGLRLLLAGDRGWERGLEGALEETGLADRVVGLGYLPEERLCGFLGAAALVAYPSVGEGFGLPVLEAMACGAVVVTTPALALSEVGGDAVLYSGPGRDELEEAIRGALAMSRGDADAVRTRALRRADGYTWDRCAAEHAAAYHAARADPR